MKHILTLFFILLMGSSLSSQDVATYCLKLTALPSEGNSQKVKIEMQGNIDFKLGTSNLQFEFNTDAIGTPTLFGSVMEAPFYHVPTITMPFENICSFNVELMSPGAGLEVPQAPEWVEIGVITFEVINANADLNLAWAYNGGTTETVAYLDDEATFFYATSEDCLEVVVVLAIEELEMLQDLTIFPNPSSKIVNVSYSIQESTDITYTVYDPLGRVVTTGDLEKNIGNHKLVLEVENYAAGQYIITFEKEDKTVSKRFDVTK